ncbi:MAG: DUF1513 domain-containing protein, partial [Myxococcales bacterium]|nr:DUF1513 domain-containing protein [Myxococcales bacterium]
MVARRPGTAAVEVDLRAGRIRRRFAVAPDRLLCGHACFSADGQIVFTTEVDAQTGAGRVGVRDARTYAPLGELDTNGLGPHELALMPDGRTLVVANGGLLTRPESGRQVLNLDTMDPSLVYLDLARGAVVEQVRLAEPKASVRHLAVAQDGTVAVATQVQREAMAGAAVVPLAALHRRGEPLRPLAAPEPVTAALADYLGSVALSEASGVAGFTSPRGDLAAFWRLRDGAFLGYHRMVDVCGLAVTSDQQRFVLSNSLGELRWLDAHTLAEDRAARRHAPGLRWDNHLIAGVL